MQRIYLALVPATSFLPGLLAAGEVPFVHLQTDRSSYRIGETIWFRAHTRGTEPVRLVAFDPHPQQLWPEDGTRPFAGGAEELSE